MNIVYLVFGPNLDHHLQANFSILSFLLEKEAINQIIILTDQPQMYRLQTDKLQVELLSQETISEWRGEHDFFWRIKIKGIEYVTQKWKNADLLYLDADTFLIQDLSTMASLLKNGKSFMHVNEGKLSEIKAKTTRLMWTQTKGNVFGGLTIHNNTAMWNAGAIGIPSAQSELLISSALKICDDMCQAKVTRRLIEQFAFSVSLQHHSEVQAANQFIGHYWGNKKEWLTLINHFFAQALIEQWTLAKQLEKMKELDFFKIPINITYSSNREKWMKLVQTIFPDRNKIYIDRRQE